jgi:hypothetical protein
MADESGLGDGGIGDGGGDSHHLEMGSTGAGCQDRERSGHPQKLFDLHLLARGMGEAHVAGSVVQGWDAAEAGIQSKVAAVGRGRPFCFAPLDGSDRRGNLIDKGMSAIDAAAGELPTPPIHLNRVVA